MSSREEVRDLSTAGRAIEAAWSALDDALADPGAGSSELLQLAVRLHKADDVVRSMESRTLSSSMELVREALARFEGIRSVEQLVQECPRAICRLGFDRAMLSLVDKSVWTPASAHSEREPEWTRQLVASGQAHPQDLVSTLPEFELVRRARSIIVDGVQQHAAVNEQVVRASGSRSYVAAGVLAGGVLVGLLHADRYFQQADVGELDRSVLGLFAEAFGHVLAKAVVTNHAAEIRSRLASLTSDINEAAGGLGQFRPDFTREPSIEAARAAPIEIPLSIEIPLENSGLTPRELQVLGLMARGASNMEIGSRLFISTGTVKAHVKHILRKLGAANRAEAVSRWFSSGAGRR
jgi:DNA-binding CsgD family transcriptional regulator